MTLFAPPPRDLVPTAADQLQAFKTRPVWLARTDRNLHWHLLRFYWKPNLSGLHIWSTCDQAELGVVDLGLHGRMHVKGHGTFCQFRLALKDERDEASFCWDCGRTWDSQTLLRDWLYSASERLGGNGWNSDFRQEIAEAQGMQILYSALGWAAYLKERREPEAELLRILCGQPSKSSAKLRLDGSRGERRRPPNTARKTRHAETIASPAELSDAENAARSVSHAHSFPKYVSRPFVAIGQPVPFPLTSISLDSANRIAPAADRW